MKPGTGKEFSVDIGGTSGEATRPPKQGPAINDGQHRDDHAAAANNGQRRGVNQDPPSRKR